jgi:competence protein ComEA
MQKSRLLLVLTLLVSFLTPTVFAVDHDVQPTNNSTAIQLVDINTADIKTLAKLKGIGEVRAKAIVTYRTMHGKFTSLEQLKKVKGIGEKVLTENKAFLTI